jgi:hypothetical protein
MKIRSAFISNSSSSSFIFVFNKEDKIPSTEKEVEEFLSINPLIKENKLYSYQYNDEPITVSSIIDYILSSFKSAIVQDLPLEEIKCKNWELYHKSIYCIFETYIHSICYFEEENIKRKEGVRCYTALESTPESENLILKKLGFKTLDIESIKKAAQLNYLSNKIDHDEYWPLYRKLKNELLSKHKISEKDLHNKDEHKELYIKIEKEIYDNPGLKELSEKQKRLRDQSYELINKICHDLVSGFFKDNPEKKLVAIECSDNDPSPGSCCEHGEIFKYHNCLIVSNH